MTPSMISSAIEKNEPRPRVTTVEAKCASGGALGHEIKPARSHPKPSRLSESTGEILPGPAHPSGT